MYKFKPILKTIIWGGEKIVPYKQIKTDQHSVGESWELSGVKGDESVVAEGPDAGMTLPALIARDGAKLLGKKNFERFGEEFPLLIKFIDARQDLSIQVHPTDEIAKKQGKERGKTEMWYLMDSDKNATLLCGLKKKITPEEYAAMVENDTIVDAIARYDVKEGDCFFLPAGRIHAIGTGCFLAEIQQTSDVTYRIYDFKRKDKNGNYRELHTKQAAECINYNVEDNYRTNYLPTKNMGVALVNCPYFCTAVYDLDEPMTLDYSELDSFVILIGLKGKATLTDNEGNVTTLEAGESILVPATTKELKVDGTLKFLETYV